MSPISPTQINSLLSDTDRGRLESLAREARALTRQNFGRAIGLYTPLYISNFCSSHCVYCGFNCHHAIQRVRLNPDEIRTEMRALHQTGVQNILLLTGESPTKTPVSYLQEAIMIAKEYFQGISLEVFPMSVDDYRALYHAGADGVTVYQETYDRQRYAQVHLAGEKQNYDFRRQAPERIAKAGFRHISLGILLGLGPLAEDLADLYAHLREMEQLFPGAEYSLSFPRLRTIRSREFTSSTVDDVSFIKILCLTRILFPRVGINLSTRESPAFRNKALEIAVTRISIGSRTTVGGYAQAFSPDPQFDMADERSAQDMIHYLKQQNFDPVFTDWRQIDQATS